LPLRFLPPRVDLFMRGRLEWHAPIPPSLAPLGFQC
jgi:hypothetical protein